MKNILILLGVILLIVFGLSFLVGSIENKEEQEFNQSGQAKAIENETDLWNFYEIEGTDLFLKYPHSVSFAGRETQLLVENTKIDDLDYPSFDKEDVLSTVESLKKGEYGTEHDWELEISKKVRDLKGINAQEYMVLSRFEICDVTLERKALFFKNDRRIIITLKGNKDLIIPTMSEYFEKNEENCGDQLIWNFDKIDAFYNSLKEGKGSEEAQSWFNSFDEVVDTIELNDQNLEISNNYEKIKGRWISVDDEKSILDFSDKYKVDFYDGVSMIEGPFLLYNEYPITRETPEDENGKYLFAVTPGLDPFVYEIVKLDEHNLEMIYLDRWNTLRYTR